MSEEFIDVRKEPVYYCKRWFKYHEVKILAKEKYNLYDRYSMEPYYKYLVEFPNGKRKYVHENELIIGERDVYEF